MRLASPLLVCVIVGVSSGVAVAGPVTGKLDLPPAPERPAVVAKGFLDRVENPLAPVRPAPVTQYLVLVLESDGKVESPAQVTWELAGESFARPVVAVPVGAEVVIKNTSKVARTLVAAEDPKLMPKEPVNPTGSKSFRPTEPKILTIGDTDAPHLKGVVVVVPTKYVAYADAAGRFDFGDVPEGSYKLRVFYRTGWIDRPDESVNVGGKKTEVSVKIPAGYPLKK